MLLASTLLVLLAALLPFTAASVPPPKYITGENVTAAGGEYLALLDIARRMLSPGDVQFMTPTGVLDPHENALSQGAAWAGNIWTQNTYGFAFASAPFLPEPLMSQLRTSFLWWFDHAGDGGNFYGGLPDVPAGMLCDNGNPTSCNYMQCGPGRNAKLKARHPPGRLRDTNALGHDWIIEGTLAATLMQAEALLATRNATGARAFFPIFKQTSDFLETRRVQDGSPLTPGAAGLFFAGNGANLLAPGFGGQGLPAGCLVNASCGTDGFPECCQQRGMAYLAGLTVTYSAVLDRLVALESLAYPNTTRNCTRPTAASADPSCLGLWKARRAANDASVPALFATMAGSNTTYLLKALSPDGERHGEYVPRPACAVDGPCPPASRHGYFEASPNIDAVALRTVSPRLAAELYASMRAVGDGIIPCGWTLPNFPDYDDSGHVVNGKYNYGYGTWVSGGFWATLEGRAILAHYDQRRYDLAAASMGRLVYPYAQLFKMDMNPIAHQGCGPGMYAETTASRGGSGPLLEIDTFAIPAAFLRGLLLPEYGASVLTLRPRLPSGLVELRQLFPMRWGDAELFVSLVGPSDGSGGNASVTSVALNGVPCSSCVGAGGEAVIPWSSVAATDGAAFAVALGLGGADIAAIALHTGAEAQRRWRADEAQRQTFDDSDVSCGSCALNATVKGWAANATAFVARMRSAGMGSRPEAAQASAFLQVLNTSVTRCVGRADSTIAPLPEPPPSWSKYAMAYNQSEAEAYFEDAAGRVWRGLGSWCRSYDRSNASPVEAAVLAIWLGRDVAGVVADAAEAEKRRGEIAREIAELEARLRELRRGYVGAHGEPAWSVRGERNSATWSILSLARQ